jgi:hypothetical protein
MFLGLELQKVKLIYLLKYKLRLYYKLYKLISSKIEMQIYVNLNLRNGFFIDNLFNKNIKTLIFLLNKLYI